MKRFRFAVACLLAGLTISQTGCLTLYSKTEVVRGSEARRAVSFENNDAANNFQTTLGKMEGTIGGSYLGVPFVNLYCNHQTLSENALWNDAVIRCDTNQDGVITGDEAVIFAKATSH